MQQKTVLVKSYFKKEYKYNSKEVPTGNYERGLFGNKKPIMTTIEEEVEVGSSKSDVDSKKLAEDLQAAILELNNDNYTVKQIIPIISGYYDYFYSAEEVKTNHHLLGESISGGGSFGLGYGFSFTDSLIIIANKNI